MRHSLLRTTNFAKLFTSAPVNSTAKRVIQPGTHYDLPPQQEKQPMISPSDLLLFCRLFGEKRFYNCGQRQPGFLCKPLRSKP